MGEGVYMSDFQFENSVFNESLALLSQYDDPSQNPCKCEKRTKDEEHDRLPSPSLLPSNSAKCFYLPPVTWPASGTIPGVNIKKHCRESGLSLDYFSRQKRLDREQPLLGTFWLALCLRHTSAPQRDKEALKVSESVE